MFDILPHLVRDELLDMVRSFFCEHGHELADCAGRLGGAAAEARVIEGGLRLETADRLDGRFRRDLVALHDLLSLQSVGDPDLIETELFSGFDPASREVERICLLSDGLAQLLRDIGEPIDDWRLSDVEDVAADILV